MLQNKGVATRVCSRARSPARATREPRRRFARVRDQATPRRAVAERTKLTAYQRALLVDVEKVKGRPQLLLIHVHTAELVPRYQVSVIGLRLPRLRVGHNGT